MKQVFMLSVFIFGMGCATHAQQLSTHQEKISISMTATQVVEADLIIFNININAEGDSPRSTFNLHKQREGALAGLLKEFDIKEEDINFQPIRINKRYNNNRKSQFSATSQQVSVTFSDFDIYENIQLSLIENDFDSFSGSFSSTKLDEGKERALISAIESAKEKAALIAKISNVSLGPVSNISYSDYSVSPVRGMAKMEMDASSSMMDFSQMVSVTATISIDFSISD